MGVSTKRQLGIALREYLLSPTGRVVLEHEDEV